MRKLFLSIALLSFVLLSTTSYAQLRIGLRAGANIAGQARDIDTTTLGSKVGFVGGVDAQYWFSMTLGLNVQLLFDQKGVEETDFTLPNSANANQPATMNRSITLNYLEIPVLLRANLSEGKYRPYVFAGPSLGLFLSGTKTQVSTGEGVGSNLNTDPAADSASINSETMASPSLSLAFGAGVAYKMTYGPAFTFDVGYAMGLSKITKAGVDDPAKIRSSDIRIMLGISFQMGDARELW